MNRLTVLQKLIEQKQAKTYLEIGVSTGWLFFKIKAPAKVAVDPHFAFPWYNKVRRLTHAGHSKFYEETSDAFFEKHADVLKEIGGVDVAFVDGLHTWDQAYRDVLNVLPYLNPGGIILMHDCNPPNEACAYPAKDINEYRKIAATGAIPGYLNSWNGDVWKAVVQLRAQHQDLVAGTIDLDWGIGFVYRGSNNNPLPYSLSDLQSMTYTDLEKDRKNLLGLVPPSYAASLINHLNT